MKSNEQFGKNTLKKQIISGKKEISGLFKNGKRWNIDSFQIIYQKNDLNQDRCAIIVSKKNGNSVKRNTIKRTFREVFRINKRRNPPFYDYLFKPETGYLFKNQELKVAFLSWISDLEKQ
jgi:ribonuclease P protein component